MNPATWKTIKETFSTALELPLPERESFLANSSEEIRREVEKLLSTYKEAQTFIGTPLIVEKGLRPNGLEHNLVGTQVDNYLILEKLGEGGMGTVFLAEHCGQGFSQRAALKLIKRGMDSNAVLGRFLMERQILAALEHPNIARLYGGGSTSDGLPYFVMEYVEGESIRDFCDNQRFDINDRLRLFTKVCEAISYAHQQLIIHRDIKPSNIIVTAAGEPKLLDFGIAKLLLPDTAARDRTATQFHVMTPDYASPEQLTGKMTTTATDVYSLGVVLYELLTGRRPFDFKGKSLIEISDALRTQRPLRPSDCQLVTEGNAHGIPTTTVPKVSDTSGSKRRRSQTSTRGLKGDLDNIVLQAIRREPERRYQSVVEFNHDIERYLAGLPVKATTDTVGYRAGKFIKRHRTMVAASLAFMMLLLVSTTLTGWQYFVARAQRAKAEQHLKELRGVAKSLLTETNAALKKLPQGLEIRKSIVEKSAAVLDNLAADETGDPNFLNELADAYDELGKIRHWQFHQSRQALSDLNKALQLRRRAIALADNVENRKKLSITLGNMSEVYSARVDREGQLHVWQDERENDLRILELEPDNPVTIYIVSAHSEDLSNILEAVGRTEESAAERKRSLDLIEKAITLQQAAPFSLDGQVALVTYSMQKANLLHRAKRLDEALAVYEAAAQIAEKTYRADNTKLYAFNHASRIHRHMANIYGEKGDWQKYLESSEFSVNWIRQNRENRNLWANGLPPSEAYYVVRTGIALNKLGQKQLATARVDEGMNLYRQAVETHINHGEDVFYAFEILQPATDFYVETNQTAKAIKLWDDYVRLTEPFVERNPDDTSSLGLLAYAFERKGDVLGGYETERETFAQTDPARLAAALASYKESNLQRQRILQLDSTNQAHLEAAKALERRIADLNARLK
jgi:serine/threonine protein kinase/tetratricopeptide (TPR) repeat protein